MTRVPACWHAGIRQRQIHRTHLAQGRGGSCRVRENDHAKDEDASFVADAWRDITKPKPKKSTYDFATDEKFPKDHRVVDFADLKWSDDGLTLFFGIKSWEKDPVPKPKKDGKKKEEPQKDELKKPESKKADFEESAAKKSFETLKEPAGRCGREDIHRSRSEETGGLRRERISWRRGGSTTAHWSSSATTSRSAVMLIDGQSTPLVSTTRPRTREEVRPDIA